MPEAAALPQGRFDGRQPFQQWLREGLAAAAQQGWGRLVLADADFVDWPLGERAVIDILQDWARPGRRCVMLAADYAQLQRRHARFVQWRTLYSHLVECHACKGVEPEDFPSVLWTPHWSLHRLDVAHCRGWAGDEAPRRLQLQELLAEWQRRATPAFPADVLGL